MATIKQLIFVGVLLIVIFLLITLGSNIHDRKRKEYWDNIQSDIKKHSENYTKYLETEMNNIQDKALSEIENKINSCDLPSEVKVNLMITARANWPNDYVTQEHWLKEQRYYYCFLQVIGDNGLRRKAREDFPLDFITQAHWYMEQVKAKDRLKNSLR